MTYPCLVLDHDDTVVNSTATVHYPCFAEYTAKFFPKAKRYTLEEYVLKNFDPGVYDFFHGEVGMTEEDMKHEQASRSSSTAGRCQRTGASPSRTRSMISWKSSASPPSRCSCSTT